jgi:glycosyltransferase involved in cell wall biosynthesis
MKVVHVITRLILGGAQENTLYNCEDLIERHGDDVTLITGPAEGPEGDLFERARRKIRDVVVLPELKRSIDPKADRAAYRRLIEELSKRKPHVVHTHSSKAAILGRTAAWKLRVPAVVHTIHGLPFHPSERWWKNRLYIFAERWAAKRCHKIITVADAMIDQAVAAGIAPREKFVTIPSGMEVEPFLNPPREPSDVRKELGIAQDAVVVAKVARLFEFKGHDDILDVAPDLLATRPNVRLLFIGGGVWRDRLEAKVRSLGLADRVIFTGLVPSSRIPELLHASDIVVHASYREGLARVLPQALISGKPVVSYDVDGAREVVLPNQTGFLAPLADKQKLAEGLATLLDQPELRIQFGKTGREMFTDRFRHEQMTEAVRGVYKEVLEKTMAGHGSL